MIDTSLIFDGTVSAGPIASIGSQTSQSTGVAITSTRVSTNIIDWLTSRDPGAGNPLSLHCQVLVALTGGTSLQITYQVCATTNGTYLDLISSPVIPAAQLIAGAPIFAYALPKNQVLNATAGILAAPGRYAQLKYTVVGPFTGGTIFSYITPLNDRSQFYAYPNNYDVNIGAGEV